MELWSFIIRQVGAAVLQWVWVANGRRERIMGSDKDKPLKLSIWKLRRWVCNKINSNGPMVFAMAAFIVIACLIINVINVRWLQELSLALKAENFSVDLEPPYIFTVVGMVQRRIIGESSLNNEKRVSQLIFEEKMRTEEETRREILKAEETLKIQKEIYRNASREGYDFSERWNNCSLQRRLPEPYASDLKYIRDIGSSLQCGSLTSHCRLATSFWRSHRYKIQYLPMPKSGSTKLRKFIAALEQGVQMDDVKLSGVHMGERIPSYFTFTFIDPIVMRRFHKSWKQLQWLAQKLGKQTLEQRISLDKNFTFENWRVIMEKEFENPQQPFLQDPFLDVHLLPQSWFLGQQMEDGIRQHFNFIGNMESFIDSLGILWEKLSTWGVPKEILNPHFTELRMTRDPEKFKKEERSSIKEMEASSPKMVQSICASEGTLYSCLGVKNIEFPDVCKEAIDFMEKNSWIF